MRFNFENTDFRIRFEYQRLLTHCYIEIREGETWRRVSSGWAQCAITDQFVKKEGRCRALKRALDKKSGWLIIDKGVTPMQWVSCFPSHWDRKSWNRAAWECYLNRGNADIGSVVERQIDRIKASGSLS